MVSHTLHLTCSWTALPSPVQERVSTYMHVWVLWCVMATLGAGKGAWSAGCIPGWERRLWFLREQGCHFSATHVSTPFLHSFSEHEWKLEGLFDPDPSFLRGDGDNKNRGLLSTPGPGVWTALVCGWALVWYTLTPSLHLCPSLNMVLRNILELLEVTKALPCEICLGVFDRTGHLLMCTFSSWSNFLLWVSALRIWDTSFWQVGWQV